MKRFLVFTVHVYYPSGGWSDFAGSFTSLEEAKAHVDGYIQDDNYRWGNVADTESLEIVYER